MKPELGSLKRTSQGTNPATPRAALDESDIALAKHISDSMGFNILDLRGCDRARQQTQGPAKAYACRTGGRV